MAKTDIQARLGLDTTAFQRGMARAQKRIQRFTKSAVAEVGRIGAAFAGVSLVRNISSLGLAAEETASKFKAVFGPAVGEMNQKVVELRKTIPSTTAEMQNALATFAQMANAFGLNSESANMFSVQMVKIAGDIASFNNLPIEEAFTKIRSAISGEFEPMKALGIVINQARLDQEALNLAVWDGTGQMSAAQKALAVQSILIRDMGEANGDAALTANSAANQVKFLQAQLKETGTEIGTTILPALAKLTQWTADFTNGVKGAMESFGAFIGKMAFTGGMSVEEFEAKLQLESEGAFEGKAKRGDVRKKLIRERVEENRKAAEEKKKQDEEALKNSENLGGELEKQIDAETDPARKKALQDRLAAYNKLLEAAGKLTSIEKKKPEKKGKIKAEGADKKAPVISAEDSKAEKSLLDAANEAGKGMVKGFLKGDPMRDIRFEKLADGGFQQFIAGQKGGVFSQQQMMQALSGQPAGVGVPGVGGAPGVGVPGAAQVGGVQADQLTGGKTKAEESTEKQTEILKGIEKTLTKLDSALSGNE